MKLEKSMTLIVRGTGLLCLAIAAWQLSDILRFLWDKRDALGTVNGYGEASLPVGILSVSGIALWICSGRLGQWLCKEPARNKRRALAQEMAAEEEGEQWRQ